MKKTIALLLALILSLSLAMSTSAETGSVTMPDARIVMGTAEFTEKGEATVETHKVYMDVQYIIEGEEQIFYGDATNAPVFKPHNDEKDVGFYLISNYDSVVYKTGEAIALYPQDAHMPGCCVTEPKTIKKAVIKIRNK
jgi:YhcH/YjgK/YiaL family protein